jgi:endonuclease/exonuclease/phosphatase family metal-dependent hydrolase
MVKQYKVSHQELKLATYNIHSGVGTDKVFNMQRIVDVIKELDADVIALQEVEHQLISEKQLIDFIRQHTEFFIISGVTFKRNEHDYGNVLLTRYPIKRVELHDISIPSYEPRGLIEASIDIKGTEVLILATHLGLKRKERQLQVKKILPLLAASQSDITILMGDLNEWFGLMTTLKPLNRIFKQMEGRASFPARFPFLSLDKIWVAPDLMIQTQVHASTLAREASDHLPVMSTVRLTAAKN